MGHFLPPETVSQLRALGQAGMSMREVARRLGISKNTAAKYLAAMPARTCQCGAPAGHKGWCKNRYARSIARQAFHAARSGRTIVVPPPVKHSRVTESVKRKRVILGIGDDWKTVCSPLPKSEHYGAIGEVWHFTRRLKADVREDVRSEMLLACLEGRLPRSQIKEHVVTFLFQHTHRNYAYSLDAPMLPNGSRSQTFLDALSNEAYLERLGW